MKQKTKHLLSFFTIAAFVVLALASAGTKKMSFTKEGGQIPPDFSSFKDTLLVISHGDDWGYNKFLRNNFKENYTGPYLIIKETQLEDYPVQKYLYMFDHRIGYATQAQVGGNTPGRSSTYAADDVFFLRNRDNGKYYQTASSSAYAKLMKAYIKALESERNK